MGLDKVVTKRPPVCGSAVTRHFTVGAHPKLALWTHWPPLHAYRQTNIQHKTNTTLMHAIFNGSICTSSYRPHVEKRGVFIFLIPTFSSCIANLSANDSTGQIMLFRISIQSTGRKFTRLFNASYAAVYTSARTTFNLGQNPTFAGKNPERGHALDLPQPK